MYIPKRFLTVLFMWICVQNSNNIIGNNVGQCPIDSHEACRPSVVIDFEQYYHEVAQLSEQSALQTILARCGVAVVKFSATWCPVCRQFNPIFQAVAQEHSTVLIDGQEEKIAYVHVDIDLFDALSELYNIDHLPTTLFFKHGVLVSTVEGYQSKTMFIENIQKCAQK